MQASPPTDITSLSLLIGLLTYYLKFVPNFATIVEPLHALLRKDVSFQWKTAQKEAFAAVRDLIRNSDPLAVFDVAQPTVVTTDASNYGLGAVL